MNNEKYLASNEAPEKIDYLIEIYRAGFWFDKDTDDYIGGLGVIVKILETNKSIAQLWPKIKKFTNNKDLINELREWLKNDNPNEIEKNSKIVWLDSCWKEGNPLPFKIPYGESYLIFN